MIRNIQLFTSQKKLILYFFIAVIFIFLLFNTIFYRLYSANIEQVVIKENKSSVAKTSEFTDMVLQNLDYTADIIQNNTTILKLLEPGKGDPAIDNYTLRDMLQALQGIATDTFKYISSIDLYLSDSGKLITTDYGVFSGLSPEITDYYRILGEGTDKFILSVNYRKQLTFIMDRNYEQVTLIRPFFNIKSGVKMGVVALNLDKYNLKNIMMKSPDSSSFILDEDNNEIASEFGSAQGTLSDRLNKLKPLLVKESGEVFFDLNGEKQILIYNTSAYTGWKFATVIPASTTLSQMSELRDYILLLFLLMNVVTAFVLILLTSDKVYKRLKKLISSMKEVEKGNFNVSIQQKGRDEFAYMYASFNSMVGRIRMLFGELYQQKLLQKDAELKLLQSKINPHFIYNIFDNMNWLIQLERYNELEKLVDSVSDYYKRSLNAGHDFISVADTVKQLESYVEIQRIRFRNRFTCCFDFDEAILDLPILNFMLQPILENAICHGVEPKAEKSTIYVKGFRSGELVCFSVEDDGVGIEPEKLEKINEFLDSEQVETDNYFALANINKRIKLFYGGEYGLRITSQEVAGTKVTVTIPYEQDKAQ